jgi:hypothetical protein
MHQEASAYTIERGRINWGNKLRLDQHAGQRRGVYTTRIREISDSAEPSGLAAHPSQVWVCFSPGPCDARMERVTGKRVDRCKRLLEYHYW